MSWMNRQLPGQFRVRIGSCAANAEQELMLGECTTNNIRIMAAVFTGESSIITSTAAAFGAYLVNQGTSGTLNTTVANYGGTLVGATLAATQSISLTLSTVSGATQIDSGEVLTWKETTVGTGTARSNGAITVEYIIL